MTQVRAAVPDTPPLGLSRLRGGALRGRGPPVHQADRYTNSLMYTLTAQF